jgi:hypothetical protein
MPPNSGPGVNADAVPTAAFPRLPHRGTAADLFRLLRRELERTLEESKGDREAAFRIALRRARDAGVLSDADLDRLQSVFDIALASESRDSGAREAEAVAKVEALYFDALADPNSTPEGLAAMDAMRAVALQKPPFGTYTMIGMVTGGFVGLSTSAGWEAGALIGAAVGFVIDILVGSKDE